MSIYEYDAEKHMAMEKAEAYERTRKRVQSVWKLYKQGKEVEEIATECNTTVEKVRGIIDEIEKDMILE